MPGTSPAYHPWNLQQINTGGVTNGPVAVSDPFASVFHSQQHVGYRDQKGTIWDSWYDGPKGKWNLQHINAAGVTNGPVAVGGPFIWVYGNQQHFTYRDQKGTIWDSWYDGPKGKWNLQQLNVGGVTNGPPAVSDPFASIFHSQQHVGYRDQKGTIWDSWYDAPKGKWNLQHINVDGVTNGPSAVGGPFIWVYGNQQHFTYRDQKGTIWDSWYDGKWNLQHINAGGVTNGPPTSGDPFASIFHSQQHVFYRDQKGTIWDSWYDGKWNLQHINAGGVTNGPPTVRDPFASCFGKEQQHVGYRDGVGAIWDSWYDGSTSHWNLQEINAGGVTKGPAALGAPFVWTVGTQQQHFTYRDQKGTIWDSWYDGPPSSISGLPTGWYLYISSVTIVDSSGNQISAPIAGQAFKMCVNVVDGGTVTAPASTLTVVMTPSDNSSPPPFAPANVPVLQPGTGANICISVPALTAGLTYDFNFYDPSSTHIGYESFPL